MPTYTFRNRETGEIREEFLSISEMERFEAEWPIWERVYDGVQSNAVLQPERMGRKKADSEFRSLLNRMKKYYRNSTIES